MSWQKITLPLIVGTDPDVVRIGDLAREIYLSKDKPAGFAMFHSMRGSAGQRNDTRLVYFTPVAAELCSSLGEDYKFEACEIPACDEPDMAFVFGDPLMMGQLQPTWTPGEEEVALYYRGPRGWIVKFDDALAAPPKEPNPLSQGF
jgi:hypothetical protein